MNGLKKRVVATGSFHQRERFDFIEVIGSDGDGGPLKVWYCQCLQFFRFKWQENSHNVAFITWCKGMGNSEVITGLTNKQQVIAIEVIKDQAFLCPDFRKRFSRAKDAGDLRVDKLVKRYQDKKAGGKIWS